MAVSQEQPIVSVRVKGDDAPRPGPVGIELKIPLEQLRKRKIFLAVPMYGGISHGIFTRSALELSAQAAQLGIPLQLYFLFNESLITRARNYCCDEFLRSDCTHMLFIDSDIGFTPQDVFFMLAMMGDDDPYDVMTAPYPKKTIAWEKIVRAVHMGFGDPRAGNSPNDLEKFVGDYVFNLKDGQTGFPIGAPVEVAEAGTGFMMIKRSVFAKFAAAFPEKVYRPDHIRDKNFDGTRFIGLYFQAETERFNYEKFFRTKLEELKTDVPNDMTVWAENLIKEADAENEKMSQRYLSEDYLFCKDVQKIGLKVWLCPWMQLQHAGSYIFGGSLRDLAQIGASATANPDELKHVKEKQVLTPSGLPPVRKKK